MIITDNFNNHNGQQMHRDQIEAIVNLPRGGVPAKGNSRIADESLCNVVVLIRVVFISLHVISFDQTLDTFFDVRRLINTIALNTKNGYITQKKPTKILGQPIFEGYLPIIKRN